MSPNIAAVRAWALIIVGCAGVVYGFVDQNAALLIAGFGLLGGEPVARAVNGRNA